MAHRTKAGQEVHDAKVAEIARRLARSGYRVLADLPGHPQPPVLNGYRPDVIAQKGRRTLVREVETRSTVAADKAQQQGLRRWAQDHGAEFRTIVAKRRR